MGDIINEIIDVDGIDKAIDKVIKKVDSLEKRIEEFNTSTIEFKINVDGVSSLADVSKALNGIQKIAATSQDVVNQAKKETIELVALYKMETEASKQKTERAKQDASDYIALKRGEAEAAKASATAKVAASKAEESASKATATAVIAEAKAATENARAKEIETRYTIALAKEKERLDKLAAKEQANLEKELSAYSKLSKEYNNAAKEAQNLGAKKVFLEREIAAGNNLQVNQTELSRLSGQLNIAQTNAKKLHDSLMTIDQAVGKSQRNVGNYNGAVMAMSQVLREAPSFAYSFSTGLMGISNNIPILVDEINRLKVANTLLKESGEQTIPIWKTLLQAFTSPVGIITIITAAVTIFSARMTMAGNETEKAAKKIDEFKKSIQDAADAMAHLSLNISNSTDIELVKAQRLIDAYNNVAISASGKLNVYEELQGLYPKVLTALTDEEKKTMELSQAHEAEIIKLREIISMKNKMNELDKVSDANIKLRNSAAKEMAEIEAKMTPESKRATARAIVAQGSRQQHVKYEDAAAGVDAEMVNHYLDLRDIQAKAERTLETIRKAEAAFTVHTANMENAPDAKDKKKKQRDDNHKNFEAELAEEKAAYEHKKLLNQKAYDESHKTFEDDKIRLINERALGEEHATKMVNIIEKWHGKVHESDARYKERKEQEANDLLAVENATTEAEQRNAKLIMERHIKAGEEIDKVVNKWEKERKAIESVNAEIDLMNEKSAIDHSRATGINPLLAGLGINMPDNTTAQKLKADILKAREDLDIAKRRQESVVNNPKSTYSEVLESTKQVADKSKDLRLLEIKLQEDTDNKIIESKRKLGELTVKLAQEAADAIKTIRDNEFAAEEQRLQYQQKQLQIHSQQKIAAINATAGYQIQKDNEVAKVVAQTTAQQQALQQKQNELALKKARADKEAAEAAIVLKTAIAIAQVLPMLAGPQAAITGPIGLAQIALITALGAAQYAAAASTPLPQFYKGGTTETPVFKAGEQGRELGITPSGDIMMFNKDAAYTAPIGTTIKNNADTERIINYAVNNTGKLVEFSPSTMTDENIVKALKENTEATIRTALAKQPIKNVIIINNGNPLQRKR